MDNEIIWWRDVPPYVKLKNSEWKVFKTTGSYTTKDGIILIGIVGVGIGYSALPATALLPATEAEYLAFVNNQTPTK